MKPIQVVITVIGPVCAPDSQEASAFLDRVEATWDAGMGEHLDSSRVRWSFGVEGGETRYMPDAEGGGAV